MDEIDIWRSAHLLMEQCGGEALFIAAQRVDALVADGDAAGSSTWIKIGHAIEDLKRRRPREAEAVN